VIFLDETDRRILTALWEDGRMSWADLAGRIGLSAPGAAERVRRLEAKGVIRGYSTAVDPRSVGLLLTAFVEVTLERPAHRAPFLELVSAIDEVQECHHIAGDYDYLLKVRCGDTLALDRVISDRLKGLPGVVRTRTTIALASLKESPVLALPLPKDGGGRD
jgi:Lrp/AsnC family leucine-responsive transcriptional regulator